MRGGNLMSDYSQPWTKIKTTADEHVCKECGTRDHFEIELEGTCQEQWRCLHCMTTYEILEEHN